MVNRDRSVRHFPEYLIGSKAQPRLKGGSFPTLQLRGAPTVSTGRKPLRSRAVPAEVAFQDDGDSESASSSPRSKLVLSQPTRRPRYEGMYHCKFCPYSSRNLCHVDDHERTHTGEKPFQCAVCKRAFAQICALQKHTRTHTGERPFSCEVCQKAFARSHVLTSHKRIHTGERPYQCDTCEKEFSRRSSLLFHERTHSGKRPYKCEACGKTFTNLSSLVRHKKGVHK